MQVIETIRELRIEISKLKQQMMQTDKANAGHSMGFVPTMGFLHAGHASLLMRARQECDAVILSIYVNPLQFGPNEDFSRYPRDINNDLAIAEQAGVDLVFMPQTAEMYPSLSKTTVTVRQLTDALCGASRPGHFDGVATVLAKLFNIVQPDKAYFGMKDAQQVAVINQMVLDLNVNTIIVPCATVREADGLAMSSRNVYLSPEERKQALVLSQALQHAEEWLLESKDVRIVEQRIKEWILSSPLAAIDYVKALEYPSLDEVDFYNIHPEAGSNSSLLIALAVKFGQTRLIDNRLLEGSKCYV